MTFALRARLPLSFSQSTHFRSGSSARSFFCLSHQTRQQYLPTTTRTLYILATHSPQLPVQTTCSHHLNSSPLVADCHPGPCTYLQAPTPKPKCSSPHPKDTWTILHPDAVRYSNLVGFAGASPNWFTDAATTQEQKYCDTYTLQAREVSDKAHSPASQNPEFCAVRESAAVCYRDLHPCS